MSPFKKNYGPILDNLDIDSRFAISNMATEFGSISGVFETDKITQDFWVSLMPVSFCYADRHFCVIPYCSILAKRKKMSTLRRPINVEDLEAKIQGALNSGDITNEQAEEKRAAIEKRSEIWDRLAHSSAEIGVLFTTLMLATGVLWAKPVWGVWWTWDPRLTTSLILWLIYVAYLMLRAYAPAGEQRARFASVLGIVGFIDVPIVYLSIVWWRTVHPQVLVGPVAQSTDLDPAMRSLLMISTLAFTLLFGYLLWERVSVRSYEDKLDSLKGMFESPLR